MTVPNASSPLAVGLTHLWSEDTGNTDLVNDQAWTLVGTLPPVVSTPLGNARRGNGAGHLTFGLRPEVFADGTNQASALVIAQIIDSATGAAGDFLGKTQASFGFEMGFSAPAQQFSAGISAAITVNLPGLSAGGGAAAYNGKTVAALTVYDGVNATLLVRILEAGQSIQSNTVARTGNFNTSSNSLSILSRGDTGERASSNVAVAATMIWNRALTAQERIDILADPKVLLSAPDTTAPVLPGPLTVTNVTQTSYNLSWPQGTDNNVYAGVELSLDGGTTWAPRGNTRTAAITGRTPGTVDQVRVRGRDTAGNVSTPPLSAAVQLEHLGVLGSTILLTTGAGTHGPGLLADSVQPGDEGKRFLLNITRRPTNGVLIDYTNGSFVYNGTADTFDYTLLVDGVQVNGPNGNGSATATLAFGAVETVAPILSSPTGAATGATTASGSVSTNEANGTLFFLTTTNATETAAAVKAGASQPVTSTGVQSIARTGLLASTAYRHHFLHRDAAGNDSAVASSAQFTTQAAGDTTAPVLTGSITVTNITQTSFDSSIPLATDNVAVARYEVSLNGGTSWIDRGTNRTHTATGLTPGALIALRWRAVDDAGNVSTPALSAAVQLLAPTVRSVSLTLTTDGTTPAANLTNLRWAWWDAAPPNLASAPVVSGTGASTNASGLFTATLTGTALAAGQTGTLLILSSNGIAGSAANRAYCAPVVVS